MEYDAIGPIKILAVDDKLQNGYPYMWGAEPPTQWLIRTTTEVRGNYYYVLVPFKHLTTCSTPWPVFENALNTLAYIVETGELT